LGLSISSKRKAIESNDPVLSLPKDEENSSNSFASSLFGRHKVRKGV
jgi:hypothetical protein